MNKDEFSEFEDNDFELPMDEEWDSYSLLNGLVFYFFTVNCLMRVYLRVKFKSSFR